MGSIASQITSLTIVYSSVYSAQDQRKHQSSASLAFVRGIHRRPVNSPHKGPVTRKMFPFDNVIMGGARYASIPATPAEFNGHGVYWCFEMSSIYERWQPPTSTISFVLSVSTQTVTKLTWPDLLYWESENLQHSYLITVECLVDILSPGSGAEAFWIVVPYVCVYIALSSTV